jgi:ABC-type dipeptide/oligopeptide/nickel transport system ATPase component
MGKISINGKEYNYKPYHNDITKERIYIRLGQEKTFINVFRRNMTDAFIKSMKEIVNPNILHEQNTIWNVDGESGSGKSMAIISLAKEITPHNFTYKNVVFFDQQILDIAKDTPRDSFLIRDETVDMFGVGSTRVATDLHILSETCRKAGINLAFLSPSEKYIAVAKWCLSTVDIDYENRITRLALKDPVTKSYLGAVYVRVVRSDDYDWVMYNKAKDEFISSIREGKRTGGKGDYRSIAKEMAKKIDLENFRTKKQRIAYLRAELSNLTSGEIDMIATFMEMVIENGEESIDDRPQNNED